MPQIVADVKWEPIEAAISPVDRARLKLLKRKRGCRYMTDAVRLAINSGLTAEGV